MVSFKTWQEIPAELRKFAAFVVETLEEIPVKIFFQKKDEEDFLPISSSTSCPFQDGQYNFPSYRSGERFILDVKNGQPRVSYE